ncbi:MAG: M48 family metallopeptidase [Myxococcota bacterium]|nr:M48 family metallopeptidase [Myxococcota bacterium]
MSEEFRFDHYIETRKSGDLGRGDATRYAYSADVAMLRSFQRIRPVELAAAAVVRTGKEMVRGQLLGQAVKVGPKQFPRLHAIASHCAKVLSVPVPQMYVVNHPMVNAFTFGTEEESFIVLHSALVDALDENELKFVIGHETGHIQNKHVVYGTALTILTSGILGMVLGPLVEPALVALRAWYRRAEITCDRAGLLCSGELDAGVGSFMKLAIGSRSLYQEMDVDEYIAQIEEGQTSVGRFSEFFATHPFLPKRIQALRTFADSELYRKHLGQDGGLSIEEVDERTSRIIAIVSRGEKAAANDQGGSES